MSVTTDRPRLVLATRKTQLEELLLRHGTHLQAKFYVESRGQKIDDYEEAHRRFEAGMAKVLQDIPADQRRVRVDRDDMDRFLFAPDDVVLAIGQDGLVANISKYLDGQLVFGINPDPERYDGVLCRNPPESMGWLRRWLKTRSPNYRIERRTMVLAEREDGQKLLALNEVVVGHQSHQSARYTLSLHDARERQSSSGFLCATGTGSTGWARSISDQRGLEGLPMPEDRRLVWFVREPFPSVATGTDLDFGFVEENQSVELNSHMGEGGVIFADGIETDRLEFLTGQSVRVSLAPQTLNLVVPREAQKQRPSNKKRGRKKTLFRGKKRRVSKRKRGK